ncbi:MAG: SLC13 family permease [Holosporales bacterium]
MLRSEALELFIREEPLLKAVTQQDLARLLTYVEVQRLDAGEPIFAPKQQALHTYYVLQGEVTLSLKNGQVLTLKAGSFFGEEAALNAQAYLYSTMTASPSVVIKIPGPQLATMLSQNPENLSTLHTALTEKLAGVKFQSRKTAEPNQTHSAGVLKALGWIVASLAPVLTYQMLGAETPFESRAFLSLASAALVLWSFSLAPVYLPALLALLGALILQIGTPSELLSGFSSPVFLMMAALFGVGAIVMSSGILYRFLLWSLKFLPPVQFWAVATTSFLALVLTPFVPTTDSRAAMLSACVRDMLATTRLKRGGLVATKISAASFMALTSFSPLFLTASIHNVVVWSFFSVQEQSIFDWGGWFQAALVPSLVLFSLLFITILFLWWDDEQPKTDGKTVSEQLRLLGPMTFSNWAVLAALAVYIVGLGASFYVHYSFAVLFIAVFVVLLVFDLFTKECANVDYDWGALLQLGAILGLIQVFQKIQVANFLLPHMGWLQSYLVYDFGVFIMVLSGVILFMRVFLPYGAVVLLCSAFMIPMAQQNGISAWVIGFIILTMANSWFMPYQYTAYTAFRRFLNGAETFEEEKMVLLNLLSVIFKVISLYLAIPYWKSAGLI